MIDFSVNQKVGEKIPLKYWRDWFRKIKAGLSLQKSVEVSVALVGFAEIKKLNKNYLGKKQVTDVLSFGQPKISPQFSWSDTKFLGEIIICYPQAVKQAKTFNQSVLKEIEILLVHGFLHLLGYNDETKKQKRKMEILTTKIVSRH
jgi:probable rRNA maturation factor